MTTEGTVVGSVLADTYVIEAQIGRGGMGVVFRASHNRLPGKHVAIKMLHAAVSSDEMLARFRREAEIASLLGHPNIVHIEDYNVTPDGTPYLVLEYLQGESLAQRLAKGPLPIEQTMSIIRQVGSALAAAHAKGIVHRDLKPGNIILEPTEADGRPVEIAKVLDFGISKMIDSDTLKTDDNALLGTPQYMAPEQASGSAGTIDVRADVFALGAIVYEMLCGVPAFRGATLAEIVFKVVYEEPLALPESVSAPIKSAVHQAMAKHASERFANVSSFVEAVTGSRISAPAAATFAETVETRSLPRLAAPPLPPPPPRAGVPRGLLAAGGALIAAGAAAAAYLLLHAAAPSPAPPAQPQLDAQAIESVARQLAAGSAAPTEVDVVLGNRSFHVSTLHGLRGVKFEVAGHGYEATEQNQNKDTRWADIARQGHYVVQFRDLETGLYIAATVDGTLERSIRAAVAR